MLGYAVICVDAVDHQTGHRRLHHPEIKHTDAAAGGEVQPAVGGKVVPVVHAEGAGKAVAGAVVGGMGRLSGEQLRLVHGVEAAVLQQPQPPVPLKQVEDGAGADVQIVKPAEGAVQPVIQVAAGADEPAVAALRGDDAQHHAVHQPLLEAVAGQGTVGLYGIDAAAGAAHQQRAVRGLGDAQDGLGLHAVGLVVTGGDRVAVDQGQAVLCAHSHRAVRQLVCQPDTAALYAVFRIEHRRIAGGGIIAHDAKVGIGAAPETAPAVHQQVLHRGVRQQIGDGVVHRLPAAVEGQQPRVGGGIEQPVDLRYRVYILAGEPGLIVGGGKIARRVADKPLAGGGQPHVALAVDGRPVYGVGPGGCVGIHHLAVGGHVGEALLAGDQDAAVPGDADPVVVFDVVGVEKADVEVGAVQGRAGAADLGQGSAVGAQIEIMGAVGGQADDALAAGEEVVALQHGHAVSVLQDGAFLGVHGAPEPVVGIDAQAVDGLARHPQVVQGDQLPVADLTHAGGGGHIDTAAAVLGKVADAEKAVFVRAGDGGKDVVFIEEHAGVAAADPQAAGGVLEQGADGGRGDGALIAEIAEGGAVVAEQAAEAAHPQVAVRRLQDGVGLVGGKAVVLVKDRAHIARLLRGPGGGAAQHRQHSGQQGGACPPEKASSPHV